MNGTGCNALAKSIGIGSLLFLLGALAIAQSLDSNPEELVRRVVQNELKAERQDDSHWMYRLETEGKNTGKEVEEVAETKGGDLKRPIVLAGRELTPEERKKWDARLGSNPQAMRKTLNAKNQDAKQSQQMLRTLPNAFLFSYGERRDHLVQLNFRPNPKFHPASHEEQVFHAMEGSLWVDIKENRLAEISAHLIEKVKFGGGLLGHLDKGGTFDVKQQEVAPGYWELILLNVQMRGKALFFKTISVHQMESRSDFKRVPDNLTMAQAAEMLKKQGAS